MASMSGNSSGSLCNKVVKSSGSEGDLITDQRKRKRMESNRESARRSRMRKQQHLDGLMSQANILKDENSQITRGINIMKQKYLNVEAESCVLRAQMAELRHRLHSLNQIANFINSNASDIDSDGAFDEYGWFTYPLNFSSSGFNQPMVASADMFHY